MTGIRMSELELEKMARAGNPVATQALKKYSKAKKPKVTNGKPLQCIPAKRGKKGEPSGLEQSFAMQIRAAGLPAAKWGKDEIRFHPTRRWRFDFAWEELRIAVEIEGGTYTHGQKRFDASAGGNVTQKSRHLTPTGFHEDCIKYAEAALLGWVVIRADAKMIKDGSTLELLSRAIKTKREDIN